MRHSTRTLSLVSGAFATVQNPLALLSNDFFSSFEEKMAKLGYVYDLPAGNVSDDGDDMITVDVYVRSKPVDTASDVQESDVPKFFVLINSNETEYVAFTAHNTLHLSQTMDAIKPFLSFVRLGLLSVSKFRFHGGVVGDTSAQTEYAVVGENGELHACAHPANAVKRFTPPNEDGEVEEIPMSLHDRLAALGYVRDVTAGDLSKDKQKLGAISLYTRMNAVIPNDAQGEPVVAENDLTGYLIVVHTSECAYTSIGANTFPELVTAISSLSGLMALLRVRLFDAED